MRTKPRSPDRGPCLIALGQLRERMGLFSRQNMSGADTEFRLKALRPAAAGLVEARSGITPMTHMGVRMSQSKGAAWSGGRSEVPVGMV
jgi:hypothetical protein